MWGVHITEDGNFRPAASVSMVTWRIRWVLFRCLEWIVGRQWAQADTGTKSKHVSICSCDHICISCYQPESMSVPTEVQNNATPTHSLLGPFADCLWVSSELRLLQLSTFLLCGCTFFVQPGEGLTSEFGSFVFESFIVLLQHKFSNLPLLLFAALKQTVWYASYYICRLLAQQCHLQRHKTTTKPKLHFILKIFSCFKISFNAEYWLLIRLIDFKTS